MPAPKKAKNNTRKTKRAAQPSPTNGKRGNRKKLTLKKKEIVCDIIRRTGNVSRAAETVGVSRTCLYANVRPDEPEYDRDFALAWADAVEGYKDNLEEEAHRRAYYGEDEVIVYQGEIAKDSDGKPLTVKRRSDNLLMFLLKSEREKFVERLRQQAEVSGPGGEPLQTQNENTNINRDMTEEEAARHYMDLVNPNGDK